MIPKLIHYVWLGQKPKPPIVLQCIESWSKYLPEYEIIEWNENNSPINIPYVKICIDLQQWAYASDYIRLYALYHWGGIYFDTDMELCMTLPPYFSEHSFFAGYEDKEFVNCATFGCQKNHELVQNLIKYYDNTLLIKPIPHILTEYIHKFTHKLDIFIAPAHYFYPLNFNGEWTTPQNEHQYYTIHHWNASWLENFDTFQKDFFIRKTGKRLSLTDKEVIISLLQQKNISLKNVSYKRLALSLAHINLRSEEEEHIVHSYFHCKYLSNNRYSPLLYFNFSKESKEARFCISKTALIKLFWKSIFYQKNTV
ncbi:MAG: glycosyltransferase [Bacteroidota bacterium]|nr:glycosyltransferase [Bacteroidota bacterium]